MLLWFPTSNPSPKKTALAARRARISNQVGRVLMKGEDHDLCGERPGGA